MGVLNTYLCIPLSTWQLNNKNKQTKSLTKAEVTHFHTKMFTYRTSGRWQILLGNPEGLCPETTSPATLSLD